MHLNYYFYDNLWRLRCLNRDHKTRNIRTHNFDKALFSTCFMLVSYLVYFLTLEKEATYSPTCSTKRR